MESELIKSMLNTAASMQMLTDELDRISIHSISESRSNSRGSLHSSSKYDSAFDSHYSEDTVSVGSQVLSGSYPVETSLLPSILTPPLPYRVVALKQEDEGAKGQSHHDHHHRPKKSPVKNRERKDGDSSRVISYDSSTQPGPATDASRTLTITEDLMDVNHQPQLVYVHKKPDAVLTKLETATSKSETTSPTLTEITPTKSETAPEALITPPRVGGSPTRHEVANSDGFVGLATPQRRISDCSSDDDLTSNDPTPTMERKHTSPSPRQQPLTPRVTIIYPEDSNLDNNSQHSPMPRHTHFPKRGTVFYQESLTPQPSPLHRAYRRKESSPSHTLPDRYWDSTHHSNTNQDGKMLPKRTASILQRLKRKRGSFKEDGKLKKRLPVKRSHSEHMTYHIKRGWIDYEEDLELISHPSHPRPVGRMIDKKAGRLHVVQLYKPPSGRYGIYISQSNQRRGVFISRFADSIAEKFYIGLISPGDQIVRVNGKNIGDGSVDYVYDLMTRSDSVIFTVVPVTSRPDW